MIRKSLLCSRMLCRMLSWLEDNYGRRSEGNVAATITPAALPVGDFHEVMQSLVPHDGFDEASICARILKEGSEMRIRKGSDKPRRWRAAGKTPSAPRQ